MSTVGFQSALSGPDSPIRTIALERLKLNIPVLLAFYVGIHSDLYTQVFKKSLGVRLMQIILGVWEVGQDTRVRAVTSEVARREKANEAFEWVFETPIYAILIFNIVQALYAMYSNATTTQLLKLDDKQTAASAPLAAPAPGPNASTRVRASLTRSLPDSPMSHPAFPSTMSSDSLRRRLAQQAEKKEERSEDKQVAKSGDSNKPPASQSNRTREGEQPTPSKSLPLSRLLQTQSQLSSSQSLRSSLGLLAPSPSLSSSYLSRSGIDSLNQTTGFSLPTPARTTDDESFASLRTSSSRRYKTAAQVTAVDDLGGISADALHSYRARHPDGPLGRSMAGSAVDRVRALGGFKESGTDEGLTDGNGDGQQRQMIAA